MKTKTTSKKFDLKTSYVGTCQACFQSQVIKATGGRAHHALVLHGYKRPGYGCIEGECWGVNNPPYELDCELTKRWKANCEKSLTFQQGRLADLQADKVEAYTFLVPDRDAPRAGWGLPQPTKAITLKRGEKYVDAKYNQTWTFEGQRRESILGTEQYIRELVQTIAFLGERITAWVYAPEALLDHETVKRNAREASEQNKLAAGFRRDWKDLWKRVAEAIEAHKKGYTWTCAGKRTSEAEIEAFFAANPFPTDKARKGARDNAKK